MTALDQFRATLGAQHVLQGTDAVRYAHDWTKTYLGTPSAVLRPGSTEEVGKIMRLASQERIVVAPLGGNTGLTGASYLQDGVLISLERLSRIQEIRPSARLAVVEAGVVMSRLHDATQEHDLLFPMTFGAKGSATIGGMLATNSGGSNVLRYGNMRDLCLGIEAVLPDGRIMSLMSELHKDNSGYNLRHLLIGAEGSLGIITRAVLKLFPRPAAYETAMIGCATIEAALQVLNHMQEATGGAVEAFEYMSPAYLSAHLAQFPAAGRVFDQDHVVTVMMEIGLSSAVMNATGGASAVLEAELASLFERDVIQNAVIAQNEAQRRAMWERREQTAEVALARKPVVNTDIAVPIDQIGTFLARAAAETQAMDAGVLAPAVAHLGDGNVHYAMWPSHDAPEHLEALLDKIEEISHDLGGSFSAEHGIGLHKLGAMRKFKDPVSLEVMRAVKQTIDPLGIMNPGKVIPSA